MPKRKVPSGLKRASGMLMSPVGPAFATEDAQHAATPTQHARKRRMAPFCRIAEVELRVYAPAKATNPARLTLAGSWKYLDLKKGLSGGSGCCCCYSSLPPQPPLPPPQRRLLRPPWFLLRRRLHPPFRNQ